MKKATIVFFLLHTIAVCVHGQDYFLPINREWNLRYEPLIESKASNVHTSIKPFRSKEISVLADLDSLNSIGLNDNKVNRTWFGRKLRREDLVSIKDGEFALYINPLFDFSFGKEIEESKNIFTNTRGVWVRGTVGERFSFSSTFNENQAVLPNYTDTFAKTYKVIPGDGRIKNLYGNFDYANVTGTVSYSLKKYFNFQFGHDKNYIGDGYRSLLLSDNAYSYPFFKISTTFWKIKYMNLYTLMEDLQIDAPDDSRFKRKYATFHYLDFNIGHYGSVGVLEAVVWKSDTMRGRGLDFNYLNPVIFLRPVEFGLGSPDNMILGFNLKIKITPKIIFYGQLMLDEFKIREVRAHNGWWGNKQAFQAGIKSSGLIKNLHLLTEINYVRPFTYSHRSTLTNYAHFNQALAHPSGANFYESVSVLYYSFKNFFIRAQFIYQLAGSDTGASNLGSNIFINYDTHSFEYNNEIAQGLENTLLYADIRLGYILNPKTNMKIEAGAIYRKNSNKQGDLISNIFTLGLRTCIFNSYRDF